MDTSRSQIHRLLSPECKSATVETLVRVADALGKRWKIQLVSGSPHFAAPAKRLSIFDEEQMEAARKVMRKRRNVLRQLAK